MCENKVALITGANAGIGYSLVKHLLKNANIEICMICRNKSKAFAAQKDLASEFPNNVINVIIADISDPGSVVKAGQEVKLKYTHIDYVFLNAGVMPEPSVDWNFFIKNLFSSNCFNMLATGHGLLKQTDKENNDGLCNIFSTNVFGHVILLKELMSVFGRSRGKNEKTQIIWTSSSNAKLSSYSIDNIQHKKGSEAYSSSKYLIDLLSYQFNREYNKIGIYSHVTCPGLVMTNLVYGIIGPWFWYLILPMLSLFRLFVANLTLKPDIASYSLYWLSTKDPETFDPSTKFYTKTTVFGEAYVESLKMDLDPDLAKETYHKINDMIEHYNKFGKVHD